MRMCVCVCVGVYAAQIIGRQGNLFAINLS